jgi:hypothetical protein
LGWPLPDAGADVDVTDMRVQFAGTSAIFAVGGGAVALTNLTVNAAQPSKTARPKHQEVRPECVLPTHRMIAAPAAQAPKSNM